MALDGERPMMTTREVAEALGVSVRTVESWCRLGELPGARKYGRMWFVPRAVVEASEPGRWGQARWGSSAG